MTDLLSIPLGLAIIGLAAYDDLYTYKIRNRFVVLGAAAAVCYHGMAASLGVSEPRDLLAALLNGGAALLAGAALWHFGLWSAGDAKLFAVAALLLPPSLCHARGPWLPAFILLVNASAFVLVMAAYWFVRGLVVKAQGARSKARGSGPEPLSGEPSPYPPPRDTLSLEPRTSNLAAYASGFVGFVVIMIAGRLLSEQAARAAGAVHASGAGVYLVLFILMRQISAFFRRRAVFWIAVAAVAGYAVFEGVARGAPGLLGLMRMGWISAGLMIFRVLYDRLVRDLDERTVAPGELRPGMVLAQSSVEREKLAEVVNDTDIGVLLPDGLTAAQARDIAAHLAGKGVARVQISRTAPFAVFLLLGFLVTCWLGGPITALAK